MKAFLVLLWVFIIALPLIWINQAHGDGFEDAEHWYFLHRVNDWDIKETATGFLCSTSIQNHTPKWEVSATYEPYVAEAMRRGLTEEQCARLTGKFKDLKESPGMSR